jgi:CMP/dCMP kinase
MPYARALRRPNPSGDGTFGAAHRCCVPYNDDHCAVLAPQSAPKLLVAMAAGVHEMSSLQIAIDGPAASGKTTVARRVAERLSVLYLDTGAMYRALAYAALHTQTDLDNENALVRLCAQHRIHVTLDSRAPLGFHIYAGERELTQGDLESPEVTAVVSTIAAHPRVRQAMVDEQRHIAESGPVVMAGRDIGTVVLPDAPVKVFLTASVQARVERRRAQLEEAGVDVSAHELAKEIEERDRLDESRAVSPLRKAPDAMVIDSSSLTIDDVVDRIVRLCASTSSASFDTSG